MLSILISGIIQILCCGLIWTHVESTHLYQYSHRSLYYYKSRLSWFLYLHMMSEVVYCIMQISTISDFLICVPGELRLDMSWLVNTEI